MNNDEESEMKNKGKLLNTKEFDEMENDGINVNKSKKILNKKEYDNLQVDEVRTSRPISGTLFDSVPTELFVSLPSGLTHELTSASLGMIKLGNVKQE